MMMDYDDNGLYGKKQEKVKFFSKQDNLNDFYYLKLRKITDQKI